MLEELPPDLPELPELPPDEGEDEPGAPGGLGIEEEDDCCSGQPMINALIALTATTREVTASSRL
jgi:hypothetical protein